MNSGAERGGRLVLIDALRGAAILAMIVYHLAWDLYFLGFSAVDVMRLPAWIGFQKSILSSFLMLSGMSLVLAHARGLRARAFLRRLAVLVAAALLVSLGSYLALPDYFVFFGVLHAIALFSVLTLPFLVVPRWLVLATAGLVLLAGLWVTLPGFIDKRLAWIGFWPEPPLTTDIVPVFPWFGMLLLGVVLMRVLLGSPVWARLAALSGRGLGWLRFVGRHSLLIYLLHQPLLFGGLSLVRMAVPAAPDGAAFLESCTANCRENGEADGFCVAYCGCALETVTAQSLWAEIEAVPQSPAVAAMTTACAAAAR